MGFELMLSASALQMPLAGFAPRTGEQGDQNPSEGSTVGGIAQPAFLTGRSLAFVARQVSRRCNLLWANSSTGVFLVAEQGAQGFHQIDDQRAFCSGRGPVSVAHQLVELLELNAELAKSVGVLGLVARWHMLILTRRGRLPIKSR